MIISFPKFLFLLCMHNFIWKNEGLGWIEITGVMAYYPFVTSWAEIQGSFYISTDRASVFRYDGGSDWVNVEPADIYGVMGHSGRTILSPVRKPLGWMLYYLSSFELEGLNHILE